MNSNSLFVEMFDAWPEDGRESLPAVEIDAMDKAISNVDATKHVKASETVREMFFRDLLEKVLGDISDLEADLEKDTFQHELLGDVPLAKASTSEQPTSARQKKFLELIRNAGFPPKGYKRRLAIQQLATSMA